MANGMGSLYIGSSGLRTSQNALNTTANNLANVDTTGYVRQQVIQADRHYNTFDKNAAISNQQSGLGVSIADVIHSRDIFLDKSYRTETGSLFIPHATLQPMKFIHIFRSWREKHSRIVSRLYILHLKSSPKIRLIR